MRRNRSQAEWSMLIEQFDPMQQSVRNFCQQHGISTSNFYVQRQKLLMSKQSPELNGFIQAVVKEEAVPQIIKDEQKITLTLKQCEVTLPANTSASYLAAILKGLL